LQHIRWNTPEDVPFDGVVKNLWRGEVMESDAVGNMRLNRITYEICVLQTLREKLRCKEIWVVGADRYRNPDDDLPADFEPLRGTYMKRCAYLWMRSLSSRVCSKK